MKTRIHILARVKAEKQGWLAITSQYDADHNQTYSAWPIVAWVLTFECPEEIMSSDIHMFRADTYVPFGPSSPRTEWLPEGEPPDGFNVIEHPIAYLPPETIRVGEYGRLRTDEERLASYVAAYEEYTNNRIQSIKNKGDQR